MMGLLDLFTAVAALGCVAASPLAPPRPIASPTASFASGAVIGTTTSVPGSAIVVEKFLGVPFAKSPPRRFFPPEPAQSWKTPRLAQTNAPACIQSYFSAVEKQAFNNPGGGPVPESEDCLYLNIYRPQGTPPKNGWPVMAWIFGGNLDIGSTAPIWYDGSSFAANQKVMIVSIGYRTNVFGFPNAPQVPNAQQNAGFLDQRFALQWIQDNIAGFHGNKKKVTIFGESAGAYSIQHLLALPPKPLPYRAAILESPAAIHLGSRLENWPLLSLLVGCGNITSDAQFSCMQNVSPDSLRNASQVLALQFGQVDNNITATPAPEIQLAQNTFAKVPFMIGTNLQEGRIFATILGFGSNSTVQDIDRFLLKYLPNNLPLVNKIKLLYTVQELGNAYHVIAAILTDAAFTCTTSFLSNTARKNGYKNWRYQFQPSYPNMQYIFPDPGTSHTTEIPQVWGTYFKNGATAEQIGLSQYMQKTWADFAKNPSQGPGWTNVGGTLKLGFDVSILGGPDNPTGQVMGNRLVMDRGCTLLGPLLAAIGV